jgi:hypothetical protein
VDKQIEEEPDSDLSAQGESVKSEEEGQS